MEIIAPPNNTSPTTPRVVQHITKASSDQLLNKFAQLDSDSESASPRKSCSTKRGGALRSSTKKKKRKVKYYYDPRDDENNNSEENSVIIMSPSREVHSLRVLEKKSLLPQYYTTNKERSYTTKGYTNSLLFKHFGVSKYYRQQIRGVRGKSVLSAIDKTWSKTVRGASKIFMGKHYSRHRILIDDIV